MSIKISKALLRKLPEAEQAGIEDYLRDKANGRCYLCNSLMNEAADAIVADHDIPEAEGGKTERANLHLAHRGCNAAKRNAPTIDVRPLLRLQAFIRSHGLVVRYGDVLPHFEIEPRPTRLVFSESKASFQFADGTKSEVGVMTEVVGKKRHHYAFVQLPQVALFNDDECQPRTLKHSHLATIYADLQRNPLHEAPGVRVGKAGPDGLVPLLMFDGQHKSVATWMHGRKTITCKIYFDLTAEEAIVLVNSVQAKIKKLPLSPFELAAKMSDEWDNKLSEYEHEVGSDEVSEAGFIAWLPQPERTRGKQAFRAALLDDIIADPELQFRPFVGKDDGAKPSIPEAAFKSKVLEKLLYLEPLREKGEQRALLRAQEKSNVLQLLNLFDQYAMHYEGPEPPPHFEAKVKRMSYQASLAYIFSILRQVVSHKLRVTRERALLQSITDEQWTEIEESVVRFVNHPIWVADLKKGKELRAVEDALAKNQNFEEAFAAVGLDAAYADGLKEANLPDRDDE